MIIVVAQQYVENLSESVKFGLRAKMKRGEMVGFHGALGYDYDKETKSIAVNIAEAEVVKYIFKRYIEGAVNPLQLLYYWAFYTVQSALIISLRLSVLWGGLTVS